MSSEVGLADLVARLLEREAALLERVTALEGRIQSGSNGLSIDLASMGAAEELLMPMNASWVLTCATLVFLMQLGFAQLEAGLVQTKNVLATYMKNLLDFVLGALAALFFGYGISYNRWPLFEHTDASKFFFHLVFQATASTILSGAIAGRIRLNAFMVMTTFMSGIVYSLAVRWTWGGGWLSTREYPFQDFAGSTVVHQLGGAAASVTAYILGPRKGRFDPETASDFDPHSVPQFLSGVLLLWVGWYGFNPGSTGTMSSIADAQAASNAAMVTTLSASAAAGATLCYTYAKSGFKMIDVLHFGNSLLAGLVAITAGCDKITPAGSLAVGMGAAIVYYNANRLMLYLEVDDVVAAGPVHGVTGAFGTIAVGLLDPTNGLLYSGNPGLLYSQIIGVLSITALGAIPFALLSLVMTYFDVLRSDEEEEVVGLDLSVFGMSAYKDVQAPKMKENTIEAEKGQILPKPVAVKLRRASWVQSDRVADLLKEPIDAKPSDTLPSARGHVAKSVMISAPEGPTKKRPPFNRGHSYSRLTEGTSDAPVPDESGMSLSVMLLCLQLVLIGIFFAAGNEVNEPEERELNFEQLYNYYIGVMMMMFVGFGYLMAFLRSYGLGAVGLTMLATCVGIEVFLVIDVLLTGGALTINITTLLEANFAVAAFLISFGALIGKISPKQIVVLVVLETVFYAANKYVMEQYVGLSDVGGTIIIHLYGAYCAQLGRLDTPPRSLCHLVGMRSFSAPTLAAPPAHRTLRTLAAPRSPPHSLSSCHHAEAPRGSSRCLCRWLDRRVRPRPTHDRQRGQPRCIDGVRCLLAPRHRRAMGILAVLRHRNYR